MNGCPPIGDRWRESGVPAGGRSACYGDGSISTAHRIRARTAHQQTLPDEQGQLLGRGAVGGLTMNVNLFAESPYRNAGTKSPYRRRAST
jgi:hypothetical protein